MSLNLRKLKKKEKNLRDLTTESLSIDSQSGHTSLDKETATSNCK